MSRHGHKEIERCKRIASKMTVGTGEDKAHSLQRHGSAAIWNCTIDGLRMDKEACVQAAREYGYGGNDAVEAVFLLGKWGYEIHIW